MRISDRRSDWCSSDLQEVRQAIEIPHRLWVGPIPRREFGDQPLRPANYGAGSVELRRRHAAARQDKALQGIERRVDAVDLRLQPRHLLRYHAQRALAAPAALGRAKVGAEIEEVVLDAREKAVGPFRIRSPLVRRQGRTGDADYGVRLVHRAVSGDAE